MPKYIDILGVTFIVAMVLSVITGVSIGFESRLGFFTALLLFAVIAGIGFSVTALGLHFQWEGFMPPGATENAVSEKKFLLIPITAHVITTVGCTVGILQELHLLSYS